MARLRQNSYIESIPRRLLGARASLDKSKAKQGKTGQGRARQDKARQSKVDEMVNQKLTTVDGDELSAHSDVINTQGVEVDDFREKISNLILDTNLRQSLIEDSKNNIDKYSVNERIKLLINFCVRSSIG